MSEKNKKIIKNTREHVLVQVGTGMTLERTVGVKLLFFWICTDVVSEKREGKFFSFFRK